MRARDAVNRRLALLPLAVLLACTGGCSVLRKSSPTDNEPTVKSLESRSVAIATDQGIQSDTAKAIAAYRAFLASAPRDAQRPEAMRRLGDLEMESADERLADGGEVASGSAGQGASGAVASAAPAVAPRASSSSANDYGAAIARYQDYMKDYPGAPRNDRVLYQLARAHEQGGDLETALRVLDRLVSEYPETPYREEAQFRRGELLFAMRDYPKAEQAYATVLVMQSASPFHERSLYMQGWSQFKQGRLDEGLASFFGVLDRKLTGGEGDGPLENAPTLTRADRELLEDTFRVASLSLENLQGAESIPRYITTPQRRAYEFRVYQHLGELFIKQDRTKDAADTFGAFARRQPLHAQAPVLQARVIEIYQAGGFANLALDAKKQYVEHYGIGSDFRRANPQGWEQAQPLIKTHLAELAQHYHASAQKSKASSDYQEAVKWYRAYLASFPQDPQAAQSNFLLAELLYEDKRWAEAGVEYEKAAYGYAPHARSADAGYAALLAYAQQEKQGGDGKAVQGGAAVESALRFAKAFPQDARSGAVLADAAEKLYARGDGLRAASVAQQVLALDPPATAAQRRVAWTVLAHASFESGDFAHAEKGYAEVLALTAEKEPGRAELVERVAASIYKQGEAARTAGQLRDAVAHFERVAAAAPTSTVRATAQYDAAAAYLNLKDWGSATRVLADFRSRYPRHPLQDDVSAKLAVAYGEQGNWSLAADEFERLAATQKDPQLARGALWQAAELQEKGNARAAAARTYERYLKQYPEPLEPAMEARWRLAQFAKHDGNAARVLALMKEILQADQAAGSRRTERTRYLGATAALALAQPADDEYRRVALVEPLQRQLKLKKARMEAVLKAYAAAADYGVAEVATAATFRTAEIYNDFGKALMSSQRPKGLSKVELEQYNVLLEEQAFPFEEKAIELHEFNARRTAGGIYDQWVKDSYAALAKLRPARYAKTERTAGVIDAIR